MGSQAQEELTGLSGWVAEVLADLGPFGVGMLTALETVFPPIPSEVVLPLAGFLTQQGEMRLPAVMVASTLGSVLGALLLYWLGRAVGRERGSRIVARVPLVDREDVDRAAGWFDRHGRSAVFFGRLIPGVRSLISLPAGAAAMPLVPFLVFTTAGSLLWNSVLVGAGVALGSQWSRVDQYAGVLDWVLIAALVLLVVVAGVRRVRKRRSSGA